MATTWMSYHDQIRHDMRSGVVQAERGLEICRELPCLHHQIADYGKLVAELKQQEYAYLSNTKARSAERGM